MKSKSTETVLDLFDLLNNIQRSIRDLDEEYHSYLKESFGRHYDKIIKELDANKPY